MPNLPHAAAPEGDVGGPAPEQGNLNWFASIVESSDDAILSKDLDGRITSWNRGAERVFGYSRPEMLGRLVLVLIPPARHDEEALILGRIRRGERIEHYETVRQRKDGTLIEVSITVSPIKDRDGRIVGASKIARDITRQKRAEIVSEGQRRVMQLIAENASLPQVLEELMQFAERAFPAKMLGSVLLLQGSQLRHGAAPNLPAAYNAAVDGMAIGPDMGSCGAAAWLKQPVYATDLATHPAWARHQELARTHGLRACWSTPILSSQGDLLGTFAMYFSEPREPGTHELDLVDLVTRTAAIAIENKRAAAALSASEAQLRLVIDNAPVLLVRTDTAHVYTFVNRAYAERNGSTPQAMIGKHTAEILGEQAYALIRPKMETALAGQRVEFELQIPYAHARLGLRWIHVIYVPDRDAAGNVTGLLAVISDIDQRKQDEDNVTRARDEALAASRAKDDFLAALSHELRTPLNPVLLLASDAAANPNLPASVRADFELIRKNVDLEARLIDDLLDLTRITRGKLQLDRRPCDLELVLQDAIVNVSVDLAQKHLRLVSDFGARKNIVLGDPVRLQQVFWNILKNAVKFTPENGRIWLEARATDAGDKVTVKISDTGIGMTAEELHRAFETFSQGDHATSSSGLHRFGGLGLGLAISKTLVEAHDGRIEASSSGRHRGATFLVELPLCSPAHGEISPSIAPAEHHHSAHPLTASIAPGTPASASGDRLHHRVLLIEDHAPTRQTLRQLLVNRHYEVVTAETAIEALQLMEPGKFDFVVSDIGLPDRNGYDLMLELRALDPRLVGIALSGYGMEDDLLRSKAAGFVVHLVKPVSIGALEAAIARLAFPSA